MKEKNKKGKDEEVNGQGGTTKQLKCV